MKKYKEKIKTLDIIGCGAVLALYHFPILKYLEKNNFIRVRYCIDSNIDNAIKIAIGFKNAYPAKYLKDEEKADYAVLTTPPEAHYEYLIRVESDMLVEKPPVCTIEEFNNINNLKMMMGKSIIVGFIRRLFPSVRLAKLILEKGLIGKLKAIVVYEGKRWSWPSYSEYPVRSKWGGVIYDTGSHALDMALYISGVNSLGENISFKIKTIKKEPKYEPAHELFAQIILDIDNLNELFLSINLSRRQNLANIIRFIGTKGSILIPTDFSNYAILKINKEIKKVYCNEELVPRSLEDAFKLEWMTLLKREEYRDYFDILEFSNFKLLTIILQTIGEG